MSLYEGILDEGPILASSSSLSTSVEGEKERRKDETVSDQASTSSTEKKAPQWHGLKMLQTHIQMKKPQSISTPQKIHVSPVVDLSARSRERLHQQGQQGHQQSIGVLRARKAVPLGLDDAPPLSFIPKAMKEDKVWLFGEVLIEDEYNPLVPNDYEAYKKKRELQKLKEKTAREVAERLQKEHEDEQKKRRTGAAIAPPSILTESVTIEELPETPSFTPSFGAGGRGLGVAANIMSKMGYREGAGLGRQGQGISTALKVENVGRGSGKIIHEQEQTIKAVSEQAVGNFEALKTATRILLLKNMVGLEDVDSDLEPEIREEMQKYGQVANVVVFKMPASVEEEEAVRIFVEFTNVAQAIKAFVDLNGRFFGGRCIGASFYSFDAYNSMEYRL